MRILSLQPTAGTNIPLRSIRRNASPTKWPLLLPTITNRWVYLMKTPFSLVMAVITIRHRSIYRNASLSCRNPLYHRFHSTIWPMIIPSTVISPQLFGNIQSAVVVAAVVVIVVRPSLDRMDSPFRHRSVSGYETILHHCPIDRFKCNVLHKISTLEATRPRARPTFPRRVNRENHRHPHGSHHTKLHHQYLWRKHRWIWVPKILLLQLTADTIIRRRMKSRAKNEFMNVRLIVLFSHRRFERRDHHLKQRPLLLNILTLRKKRRWRAKVPQSLLDLMLIYDAEKLTIFFEEDLVNGWINLFALFSRIWR